MPPVTTTSWCPAAIISSAISIARIDDAHTLLIVSAGTSFGIPAPIAAWRAGAWPGAGLEHLAHDDVADLLRVDAGALEPRTDRDRAELRRRDVGKAAADTAERRPDGGDDDGASHGASVATRRPASPAGTGGVRRDRCQVRISVKCGRAPNRVPIAPQRRTPGLVADCARGGRSLGSADDELCLCMDLVVAPRARRERALAAATSRFRPRPPTEVSFVS